MNLKQADARDSEVRVIVGRFLKAAAKMPTTWANAAACYIAGRKHDLVQSLLVVRPFEADDIRRDIKALDALVELIKVPVPEKAPRINRPQDAGVTQEEHNAWLANILTPPGWRETWGAKVQDLSKEKLTAFLAGGEAASDALAAMKAAERFFSFLCDVERHGTAAKDAQNERRSREFLNGSTSGRYAGRRRATG